MTHIPTSTFEKIRDGLETQDLAAIIAIAQHGSLTKAAQDFGVTTGGLSQRLKAIENLLGLKLFQRGTRGLKLNSNGEAIWPLVVNIAKSFDELADAAQGLATGHQVARISISSPQYFGEKYLQGWLTDYLMNRKDVECHLNLNNSTVSLDAQQFDLLFRAHRLFPDESLPPYELNARLVMRRRMVICCLPALLKGNTDDEQSLALLRNHPVLDMKFSNGFGKPMGESQWRLLDPDGHLQVIQVKVTQSTNNASTLKSFALAGLGIAMVPADLVTDELASGQLCQVLTKHCPPELVVHVMHERKSLRPQTRDLFEFILERARVEGQHRISAACTSSPPAAG